MIYDVAIIGAGVIGGMAARELSRYQVQTCLLEKDNDVAMGASRANSGIIHGGYDPVPGTLKAKMNTLGNPLLYRTAAELNVHFQNNGSLVCAFGKEQESALQMLLERGLQNGIQGLTLLNAQEVHALEPGLSPEVTAALCIPNGGIICPYDLTIAAVGNAMDNGVALQCNFQVASIEQGECFTLTAGDGRKIQAKYILNCAGGYSDRIARMIGDDSFTIIPRAGEYLLLDKSQGSCVRRTIFQVPTAAGKGILVTPTVDGNLLTGPTAVPVAEPGSTETTREGLDTVSRLAAKSVPGVDFRQVITSFTGVRASEKNGDFIIRPSEKNSRFVHVAAIDSPGLTGCVAIAKYAVEQLHELPLIPKKHWDGTRENTRAFREMTEQQQDAYIKTHPDYGKIVCRCETVSQGEILDAIRRNPPATDVDGVKRRTRSGMGRCQGGFCSPYVMKLLAESQGIPLDQVTKSGHGSRMLTEKL